jgi:hypothetical protein
VPNSFASSACIERLGLVLAAQAEVVEVLQELAEDGVAVGGVGQVWRIVRLIASTCDGDRFPLRAARGRRRDLG